MQYLSIFHTKLFLRPCMEITASCKDWVKEYMHEKVAGRGEGIEQARRECVNKNRWWLSCHGYPFEGHS